MSALATDVIQWYDGRGVKIDDTCRIHETKKGSMYLSPLSVDWKKFWKTYNRQELKSRGGFLFKDGKEWILQIYIDTAKDTSSHIKVEKKSFTPLKDIDISKIEVSDKIDEYILRPFQLRNAKIAKACGYNLCICDEMGLGKTIQALHAIVESNASKVVIICPKGILPMWKSMVSKCIPNNVSVYINNYDQFRDTIPVSTT